MNNEPIPVGFYHELEPEAARAALQTLQRSAPSPNHSKVLEFLRGGKHVGSTMMLATDLLSENGDVIDSIKLFSDGVWIWPSYLIYYMEKYYIELPEPFVLHALRLGK